MMLPPASMSDLLAPVPLLEKNLGHLRARGHEVVLFHLLDPRELSFDFDQPALFEDAESGRQIYIDPGIAGGDYRRKLAAHIDGIQTTCGKLGITYHQFTTDKPLELVLAEFLRDRMHARSSTARPRTRTARRSPA